MTLTISSGSAPLTFHAAFSLQAQKLASLEATLKSPAMARMGAGGNVNGTDHGLKDLERQLKRLAIDVRVMKVSYSSSRSKLLTSTALLPSATCSCVRRLPEQVPYPAPWQTGVLPAVCS